MDNCYSYNDDYFYDDYNEFNVLVEEWKQSLKKGLKEDIKSELESLRKEVLELREIKKEKQKYEREIANKKRELELAIEQAEKKALQTKALELLKLISEPMWGVYRKGYMQKKCNKCDHERKMRYTTPLGRETYEFCDCHDMNYVFVPTNNIAIKIGNAIKFRYFGNDYVEDIHDIRLFVNSEEDFNKMESFYYKEYAFKDKRLAEKYCELKNKDIDFDKLVGWENGEQ